MSSPTDTFSGDVYRPLLVREPSGGFILWQSRQWTIPYNPYMDAPLPCLIKQKDQLNGIECNLQLGERATRLGTWAACAPRSSIQTWKEHARWNALQAVEVRLILFNMFQTSMVDCIKALWIPLRPSILKPIYLSNINYINPSYQLLKARLSSVLSLRIPLAERVRLDESPAPHLLCHGFYRTGGWIWAPIYGQQKGIPSGKLT
jgi:hypothetical protein